MKYVKGEKYKIFFNYDLTDDFLIMGITPTINTPKTRKRARSNPPSVASNEYPMDIDSLYDNHLPISKAKKKDLETMCNKGIIPEEFPPGFVV